MTWIHSYVSANRSKSFCVYDGSSPEAVRRTEAIALGSANDTAYLAGSGSYRLSGVAPAIASAVSHATGTRIRDLPIRPEMPLEPTGRANDQRD